MESSICASAYCDLIIFLYFILYSVGEDNNFIYTRISFNGWFIPFIASQRWVPALELSMVLIVSFAWDEMEMFLIIWI